MAQQGFDISKYITAADIVSAVTAGTIAYLTYKTKQEDQPSQPGQEQQPQGQQPQAEQPAPQVSPDVDDVVFPSKMSDEQILSQVNPKPNGGIDFGKVGEYYEQEAFERYCAAKGIKCSKSLAGHMFGLHSRWFCYSKMDFDALLSNENTMNVLNQIARAGGSDELRMKFQSSFWEKLSEMSADQINQICAGSNPMQGLVDAAYGKMAIGKLMDVGEAELRVCLGQISNMPNWRMGDGMMKLGRDAAGKLIAYGKFNPI